MARKTKRTEGQNYFKKKSLFRWNQTISMVSGNVPHQSIAAAASWARARKNGLCVCACVCVFRGREASNQLGGVGGGGGWERSTDDGW